MDELTEKLKKLKKIKFLILFGGVFLFFILIVGALITIIPGAMNGIQSVGENSSSKSVQEKTGYETGKNTIFSTLCENCTSESDADKNGVLASEFYQKMSETLNLYNSLENYKERDGEFDFQLISATIQYGKLLRAELFRDSEQFGKWYTEANLTNKDIDQFAGIQDITKENAQQFFKWAAVMLGTPYSLPDINLRGLSGSLIGGRVVTECVAGNVKRNEEEQLEDLVAEIIRVEQKFSGETVNPSFWDSILSIFGISYTSDTKLLTKRLTAMFDGLDKDSGEYKDLEAFINLDNYVADKQCGNGQMVKNTYTKFMNYEQYKTYLRTVFIPQNYINCDTCVYRNGSEVFKKMKIEDIIKDIFDNAEYYRTYADMGDFKYANANYSSTIIPIGDLAYMTAPIKTRCHVSDKYGIRTDIVNGTEKKVFHYAVDAGGDDGYLYSIAPKGIVHRILYNVTENYNPNYGQCSTLTETQIGGVQIVIKYTINDTLYYAEYSHVDKDNIYVTEGAEVSKGQKIAKIGNTGCSTGPHVHFALYRGGWAANTVIDPTVLFRKCENSGFEDISTIATNDNYVNPNKCMVGDYTLDEVITSIIKKNDASASSQKEYVKATAIVLRTILMKDSDWCNNSLGVTVNNLNIEGNALDLTLYNQVIETQGIILNYSGEPLKDLSYAMFPCETLPLNWNNGNRSYVLGVLGIPDTGDQLDLAYVDSAVRKHNEKCVAYTRSGGNVSVELETVPSDLADYKQGVSKYVNFTIPESKITRKDKGAQKSYSLNIAKHLASQNNTYTQILYQFYQAKTVNVNKTDENIGYIDNSTSPGLIDARKAIAKLGGGNTAGFEYGETLAGSNITPTGSLTDSESNTINDHLTNYISTAATKAREKGESENRAKVAAAAYWIVNNPFYRVQYSLNSSYNVDGWNENWSSSNGLDSAGLVLWSLRQAGASSYYGTPSALESSAVFSETATTFTVNELLSLGIKVGDVIRKNNPQGHWAVVTKVDAGLCSIEVAHAVNEQNDLDLTTYGCGTPINYQKIYKLPAFYHDS